MNILRSQSVRAEERSIHSSHTNCESREKHAKDNACMLFEFVLKRGMPQCAKHNEYSSFSKRESPLAIYSALRNPKAGEYKRAT